LHSFIKNPKLIARYFGSSSHSHDAPKAHDDSHGSPASDHHGHSAGGHHEHGDDP